MIALILLLLVILFLNSSIKFIIKFSFDDFDIQYNFRINYFFINKEVRINFFYKIIQKELKKNKRGNIKKEFEELKSIIHLLQFDRLIIIVRSGLINVISSTISIPIISSAISFFYSYFNLKNSKKFYYTVEPIYDKLKLFCNINCIVSIKVTHIIYIIFKSLFGRRDNNGRTSNRRTNECCYE